MRLSAVSLALLLSLTACNKNESASESPKAEATTTTAAAEAPKAEPAVNLDNSPTIKMMSDVLKMGATGMVIAAAQNATQEQLDCLQNADNALFLEAAKTQTQKMLGDDLIKESDKFYETEVGQKMLKFMEQSQLQMQGKPIEGEPVVITEEDKAKMAEFGESELGKKIAKATTQPDPQEMQQLLTELANKEKARCNIS